MLQFFRSAVGTLFAKILFVVLIGAFGLWGVGDFFRSRPGSTVVATVGDRSIYAEEVRSAVDREMQSLHQRLGPQFDLQQAKAFGVIDRVVDGIVEGALLSQEAARQGLAVSDEQLRNAVTGERMFQNANGKFDRATFMNVLLANRMSERDYETALLHDLPIRLAAGPAEEAGTSPQALDDLLYRIRNEQRVADWVLIAKDKVGPIPAPTDAQLKEYYDKHHDAYTAVEHRSATLLAMTPADVADQIKITPDQIKEAYQQRLDEFSKPEQRHILQMLLPDQQKAEDAAKQLANGADFTATARALGTQAADAIDLGTVAKEALPGSVADIAFSTAEGAVSKPVKGPFGWTIIKDVKLEPGGTKSLDEVKDRLEADLRKDAAGDQLYKLSTKVGDAVSAGADIGQIAQQFNLKTVAIPAIDQEGNGPDGKPVSVASIPASALAKTAFDTAKGQVAPVQQVEGGDGFFVLKVDAVSAAALKPYDQVKDAVKAAWQEQQQTEKAAVAAKSLSDAVKPDKPLAQLAAAQKLTLATTPPLLRSKPGETLPAELVRRLFSMKLGDAAAANAPAGQYVVQLKEIRPADPATDKTGLTKIDEAMAQQSSNELLSELTQSLRRQIPVKVNQDVLDGLFAGSAS